MEIDCGEKIFYWAKNMCGKGKNMSKPVLKSLLCLRQKSSCNQYQNFPTLNSFWSKQRILIRTKHYLDENRRKKKSIYHSKKIKSLQKNPLTSKTLLVPLTVIFSVFNFHCWYCWSILYCMQNCVLLFKSEVLFFAANSLKSLWIYTLHSKYWKKSIKS